VNFAYTVQEAVLRNNVITKKGHFMSTTLLLVVIACIGLAMMLSRPARAGKSMSRARVASAGASEDRSAHPYRAVSILSGDCACDAVRELGTERFLTADAPLLPLADCNQSQCACKYRHFKDRRAHLGDRRRSLSVNSGFFAKPGDSDRRSRPGRRASDWREEDVSPVF
jgi:hypothetical protein